MLRSLGLTGIVVAISFLLTAQSEAFGFGPVFKYGNNMGTFEEVDENFDTDYDVSTFGFGFQLDTNVARNRLLNYRVEFLFEYVKGESDYEFGVTDDVKGYGGAIEQTLGFGVFRSRAARIFVGPTFRVGLWSGDGDDDDLSPGFDDTKYIGFDAGFGLTLGANFHLGKSASISTTIGYLPGVGVTVTNDKRLKAALGESDYVYDGYQGRVAASISLLFRTGGDRY